MILVLRALGIGDLATAVPALRGLRGAWPDRPLALAAPGWLAPLVELTGCVDRLIPVDGLAGEGLDGVGMGADGAAGDADGAAGDGRRGRSPGEHRPGPSPGYPRRGPVAGGAGPYRAVNLHGRGPESHRLLRRATSAPLLAFACPAAGHADGPQWRADEHEVRRWCRLLDWYGVPADPADLELDRPDPSRCPVGVTVVHPGGKEPARRWSAGRFAAVARELDRSGHRVVVTGSPAERELTARVAAAAGLPATSALTGLGLAGLAALVAHARLVVSADTGVAHLATAYRTPSVVLFGPVRPEHWGPPPDRPWHRALWAGPVTEAASADAASSAEAVGWASVPGPAGTVGPADADPDGAHSGLHPALAAIGVDEVLAAAVAVDRLGRAGEVGSVPAFSRP
ncbi:glycosyltransferase family 9 protein [Plantactinospora siamensis]|uniref:Glycosyltransferase family 9 protein n=1 Tax=Plantactinospora siamensis TaxID=555372 RepID=A0ABV6P144_9ACTN